MSINIENYNLTSNKLHKKIKIALITDIHVMDETPKSYTDNIIKAVKKVSPNYICLVGDYFSGYGQYNFKSPLSLKLIKDLLSELSKLSPVIISLGNHDLTIKKESELREAFKTLKGKNIYPLDNESIEFNDVFFSGFYPRRKSYAISNISNKKAKMIIEDWNKSKLKSHKEKLSILCHHIPDTILNKKIQQEAKSILNYDIVLSGHAHNGWLSPMQEKKIEGKINRKISKITNNEDKIKKLEEKKYHGYCESILNFPPFIRKLSRGNHNIKGTKLIISRGITCGTKLIVGNKFIMNLFSGYSYITLVDIEPIK